jgi:transcriptional regulator with AAA-type ATPase domain/tetratricopeptide (TPR) repeat protein
MKILTNLLGESPGIEAIREKVRRLLSRQQDVRRLPPILIEGETGTGKGLLARTIHRAGPRPDGPFVDVNCAAIPETLLEAEMFGFERGAFTDARRAKPGLFQAAHRGTIFLDEVGLLPEALQAKLLKVIEERAVRRLGSTRDEPVDAWIVTATNEDLRGAVRERRFREDLYHRLAVLTLTLPPLRERGDDVLSLAEHFLARACADYGVPAKTLAAGARAALLAYPWPGNIRELGNLMERVALLASESDVTAPMLGLPLPVAAPQAAPAPAANAASLDDAVRARVAEILQQTSWNISRSAALLGISRNTLRARIEKYGLRPGESVPRRAPRAPRPAAAVPAPAPPILPAAAPPALRWERRRVTLLRAALVAGETERQLETSRALEVLGEKARSFGGRIEGMSPTAIVAAFGLEAAEDAPSRAAHAAMAMQRAIEHAQREGESVPSVKIGIHLEEFLVGLGSGVAELELELKQKAIEMLAALTERGEPGSVLVSEAAAPFLERRFELLDFVGGLLGRVFALAGRARTGLGVGGHIVTFVGRHRELELLGSRLESAARGHGQIVGISGEAGIGKSRLLYEFRQSIAGKPVGYLEGRCVSYGAAEPYLPVLDLVKTACGVTDADPPDVVRARVQVALREVGLDPEEAGPYLLHLLGLAEPRVDALEPDAIKARIFETLRQVWVRRSRQLPLVVVVEDLHWIDTISEEFFAALAEILPGSRIFLVSTYRAGYRPPWIEKSYATQMALQPLAPEDSLAVIRSVLGTERLSDALAARIVAKAEGNPLFLEELARTVREQAGDAPSLAVPDTIQEVLRGRIDRLALWDKRLLQTAAVVGKDVPFVIVRAVEDAPEDALRGAFTRLTTADFLYETSPGSETEYTFKHALTHEVAYGSLLEEDRRRLHARIVAAIERVYADRLPEHVERLAHHAFHAEEWEKAFDYLREAGAKAVSRSAHQEAVALCERALLTLEHLPKDGEAMRRAIDLRFGLKTSLTALGEHERIIDYLRVARALSERLGDQPRLGRVSAFESDYFRLMGDYPRSIESGERALAIARELGDAHLQVMANTYLGLVHLNRGDHRLAGDFFANNVASVSGTLSRERFEMAQLPSVHSRTWLIACLAELGDFAAAVTHSEEGVRIAESAGHPLTLIVAYFGVGQLHLRRGDLERAVPALEHGLELIRTWGIHLWFPNFAGALGSAYALTGRLDEALSLLGQSVARAATMRRIGAHAGRLLPLGEGYLRAGRLEDARDVAARALAAAREHGERAHEAWVLRLLGEIASALTGSDAADAAARYAEALAGAEALSMRPLVARCHLDFARFHRQRGGRAAAATHLETATALFREMAMPFWLEEARAEREQLH